MGFQNGASDEEDDPHSHGGNEQGTLSANQIHQEEHEETGCNDFDHAVDP